MSGNPSVFASVIEAFEAKFKDHNFKWKFYHNRVMALCPFHKEKHRSFNIYTWRGKTYYKCFSCGEKGLVDFFIKEENLSKEQKQKIKEHVEKQRRFLEIKNILHSALFKDNEIYNYFNSRFADSFDYKNYLSKASNIGTINITVLEELKQNETLKDTEELNQILDFLYNEISFKNDDKYIVFFYTDIHSNVTEIKFRKLNTRTFFTLKISDSDISFFTPFDLMHSKNNQFCFIVEGEFDVLVPLSHLFEDIEDDDEIILVDFFISIGSASRLNTKLIKTIKHIGLIPIIALDWDNGGKTNLDRFIENYNLKTPCYVVTSQSYDDSKDFGDLFYNKSIDEYKEIFDHFEIKNIFDLKNEKKIDDFRNQLLNIEFSYPDNLKEIIFNEIFEKNKKQIYFDKPLLKEREQEFYINGLIPQGFVSIIAGASGSGKTYCSIHLACEYILETKKPAFLWLSEDSGMIESRVLKVIDNNPEFKEHKDFLVNNIFYEDTIPEPLFEVQFKNIVINEDMLNFLKYIKSKYNFIILDPLLNFYGYEENENSIARRFMNILNSLIRNTNKSIILIHHIGKYKSDNLKDEEDYKRLIRGASAFVDAARTVVFIKTFEENKEKGLSKKLKVVKTNVSNVGYTKTIHFYFMKKHFNKNKNNFAEEEYEDIPIV